MIIYHAKQSGFIVSTEDNLTLLFDIITPKDNLPISLVNNNKCILFVSHGHNDHWRSELISEFPTSHFFVSDDLYLPNKPSITKMTPNMSAGQSGLTVSTFGSTDQGVSFITTLPDNQSILHCGDLNWWHWETSSPKEQEKAANDFKRMINEMVDIDITYAFIPVDPRLGEASNWAAQYIIDTLNPMYLIPMHCWNRYNEVNAALDQLVSNDTQILRIGSENSVVLDDTNVKMQRAIF